MKPTNLLRSISSTLTSAAPKPKHPKPPSLRVYQYFLPFQTQWRDNDAYVHLNNIIYNAYGDSIVNEYLINHLGLQLPSTDLNRTPTPVGLMVNSSLSFAAPLAFPSPILAALSVSSVSKSSITWQVGLFAARASNSNFGSIGTLAGSSGSSFPKTFASSIEVVEGKDGGVPTAAAWGSMTHVFVDEKTRTPTPLPDEWREKLKGLQGKWE
ncbi:BQ2448_2390 [Microbotryum intermedium]|uniref:BQ2448_2390 protein n=1 Tax=Microbotryum intermedium TaxID=269621 RepID=A0A238F639_9BASI|nr:BQ2448_2390 [Microbotryum intermedium]